MAEVPEIGDEADAPIIVPPPGLILRRAARTKIRKPGLPGDGGGHRFGASRRGAKTSQAPAEPRTSSDLSSSDHGDVEPTSVVSRRTGLSDDAHARPESYSEESSIYDAYARDDEEESPYPPVLVALQPVESVSVPVEEPPQPPPLAPPVPSIQPEVPAPILHQPQPQRLLVPQPAQDQGPPSRTPSPSDQRPTQTSPYPQSGPNSRKDKEKGGKGLFGKWGDKGGKKGNKEKDRENRDRAAAEKDSGFFGSLFGGKKKQETDYPSSITGGTSGREAAQALLGASKSSKSYVPPTSPGLAPGIGGNPYARYPIHVERAIYRLSHIKLANPRRPLYEQVLISNLMFWYLGVINKAQSPSTTQPAANGTAAAGNASSENHDDSEAEQREREQREKEQREKAEKERAERERAEREQREREMEMKKKESGRRGSLTKSPPAGGGRRAEMPIKGPQYEMQHRVMEQEYGGYNGQPPRSPTSPRTPGNGPPGQPYQQRPLQPYESGPKSVQPQPQVPAEQYYYQSHPENHHPQQRPGLPPGAMAPMDQSGWMPTPQQRNPSPNPPLPGPHRRSQSPPSRNPQLQYVQQMHKATSQENLGDHPSYRSPVRSMSASAPPPPQSNGVLRKGNSAHAAVPHDRRVYGVEHPPNSSNGEEEDVPLAVWQQQRRK